MANDLLGVAIGPWKRVTFGISGPLFREDRMNLHLVPMSFGLRLV